MCLWCRSPWITVQYSSDSGLHAVDFLEKPEGALLINSFDSRLCPRQNVPGQPHLGEGSQANSVQELVVAQLGLLTSRDGCKAMRHGDLRSTLMDNINY